MDKNWPALVIGIVVAIYWYRVLTMVQKARRKAGHDANFIPKESVGRWLRLIWNPVIAQIGRAHV